MFLSSLRKQWGAAGKFSAEPHSHMRQPQNRDARTKSRWLGGRGKRDSHLEYLVMHLKRKSGATQTGAIAELEVPAVNHGWYAHRQRSGNRFQPVFYVADHHFCHLSHNIQDFFVNRWSAGVEIGTQHTRADNARKNRRTAEYAGSAPVTGNADQRDDSQFRGRTARDAGID